MQINFTNYSQVYFLRNIASHLYFILLSNDLQFYEFSHLCLKSRQMINDDFVSIIHFLLFPHYSFHELFAKLTAICCFSDYDVVRVFLIKQFTSNCKLLINENNFFGTKALMLIIHLKIVNFQDLLMFNTNLIF